MYSGVTHGAVSPFALINDVNNEVKFCIDSLLLTKDLVNMHPLRNDRTTSIAPSALLSFLEAVNHPPTVLDFDKSDNTSKNFVDVVE
jgi:Ala-tRNA(Pro) deacylase